MCMYINGRDCANYAIEALASVVEAIVVGAQKVCICRHPQTEHLLCDIQPQGE